MQRDRSRHDPGDKLRFKKPGSSTSWSPRLRHRVECNGFFARLTVTCRRRGWRLEWTGEGDPPAVPAIGTYGVFGLEELTVALRLEWHAALLADHLVTFQVGEK
jgi:hypothetical protein